MARNMGARGATRRRAACVVLFAALAGVAWANGAMGLGLEEWALAYWFAYVGVTVLFEAWMIGGWLKLSWSRSLWLSSLANAFTGALCGGGGLCAVGLHGQFVGSPLNPNPFFNAVALLTIFAVPSALFESLIWRPSAIKRSPKVISEWRLLGRVVVTHLFGIPLALVILLIPERPYLGLEGITAYKRSFALRRLARHIEERIIEEHLPAFGTPGEQAALLADVPDQTDMWAAPYTPEFHRFDTGEAKRRPWVWNTALSGMKLIDDGGPDDWRILLRAPSTDNRWRGIEVNMAGGDTKLVRADEQLRAR